MGRGQASFREDRSTLDHIWKRTSSKRNMMSIFMFCWFQKKTFDIVPRDKLLEHLQRLGVPPRLQQVVKTMYSVIYTKVHINNNTHCEVMSITSVKQWCPLSPHYLACTLMNLKHTKMGSIGILHVYLPQWLSFFFMLTMLFYSLN